MSKTDEMRNLLQQIRQQLNFQATCGLRELALSPRRISTWRNPLHDRTIIKTYSSDEPNVCVIPVKQKFGVIRDDKIKPLRTLSDIYQSIQSCQACTLHCQRTNVVFGQGCPTSRLMFVGEAPGRDEDLQGEAFVGESGKLLDKMIHAMGLKRTEVYISNVIKCRPPQNRDPKPEEVAACQVNLHQQIEALQPQVIVALGCFAAQSLLRTQSSLHVLRGKWHKFQNSKLIATFHPAYLLRNPSDKRGAWSDLQVVMRLLGLPFVKK